MGALALTLNNFYNVFATAMNNFLTRLLGGQITMATIVTDIFEVLGEIIDGLGTLFTSAGTSVVAIIWDETAGSMTVVGVLLLIGAGTSLFFFVLRWVISLIKIKGGK